MSEYDDRIAVIGLAGRFPGADSVPEFWRLLRDGVDAVHDYTDGELRQLGVGQGLLDDPALVRSGGALPGGALDGIAGFDAELFGFDAREAALLDPQHRLFLESAWGALEDAGCDPQRYDGDVGVFTGISTNRYFLFHLLGNPEAADGDPDDWEAQLAIRPGAEYLPARVAYRLGLRGPAIAVQTACSSSLTAVCVAAQSLLDYGCDLAVAGGASVSLPRHRHTPGGLVSPDGRTRAFDASAAGTGYGSGTGAVVLKRYADLDPDRDRVHAVLRGWAVNNDGAHRAGFAAPGTDGQAAVVAEALARAGVSPHELGYLEAHGSATVLGDAIELAALHQVWQAAGPSPAGSCALGTAKANIGNLDAASGIAALVAAVRAVTEGTVPAHAQFHEPHPGLGLESGPFTIPRVRGPWPHAGSRLAGVSSFGLGGSNAHVVLEQAPSPTPHTPPTPDTTPGPHTTPAPPPPPSLKPPPTDWHLLPLSAHSPAALADACDRLAAHLESAGPALSLADVAYTLAVGRRVLPYRAAVAARRPAEAAEVLRRVAAGPQAGPPPPDEAGGELRAAADSWLRGESTDWTSYLKDRPGRVCTLPAHPFRRRRHWIDPPDRRATTRGGPA
ncbi:beta-ketoacyl synthase N-terminal-like domain-containing protein [Streptomyces sp. NPDC057552]|uniref:beta-ketoacyl synthase N-terminal-like domain-containing protein n=1 Tax=Streptomyces sp. NPDC057552 TaxID=3350537 RepID=UPI0036C7320E